MQISSHSTDRNNVPLIQSQQYFLGLSLRFHCHHTSSGAQFIYAGSLAGANFHKSLALIALHYTASPERSNYITYKDLMLWLCPTCASFLCYSVPGFSVFNPSHSSSPPIYWNIELHFWLLLYLDTDSIHSSKVYSLMICGIFTELCNYHYNQL